MRDEACRKCELSALNGRRVCMFGTATAEDVKILVVKDKPDERDNSNGRIMGDTKVIRLLGQPVYFTSLVKCLPPVQQRKVKDPTKKQRAACSLYFAREFQRLSPRIIIGQGAKVAEYFFPGSKLEDVRGRVQMHHLYGPVLITYSTAFIHLYPNFEKMFEQDLQVAVKFTQSGVIESVKEYGSNVQIAPTREELVDFLNSTVGARHFASDVEATGVDFWREGKGFEVTHTGFYTGDKTSGRGVVFDPRIHPDLLPRFLEKPQVVHNAAMEGPIYGFPSTIVRDTIVLAHLADPALPRSLEAQARIRIGDVYSERFKGGENDWESWARRNAVDIQATHELDAILWDELDSPRRRLHNEVLLPGAINYGVLNGRGIPLSVENQEFLDADCNAKMFALHMRAVREFGWPVVGNLNSSDQVSDFIYGVLGFVPPKEAIREGSSRPSTDKAVLLDLALDYDSEFPRIVMDYRHEKKVQSNYVYKDENGNYRREIRTSFNPTGAITGRPTSKGNRDDDESNPFQTFSREARVRKNYTSRRGLLVSGDLSQAELRIAGGELARDPEMLRIYRNDEDIHTNTCVRVFGKDPTIKENRYRSKPPNFLLLYGGEAKAFQRAALTGYGIKWSLDECKRIRRDWMGVYAGIPDWHHKNLRDILLNGRVVSPLGRVYYISVPTGDYGAQKPAWNAANNYPTQGSCSDCCVMGFNLAMLLDFHAPIITIHDQVVCDVPEADAYEFAWTWKCMWEKAINQYYPWAAPMKVDMAIGPSLGELKEVAFK